MRRTPSRHLSDESDKSDESDDALSYRTSRTSRTSRTARYHIGRVGQVGRVGRRSLSPPTPPCRDWWERAGGRLLSRRPGRAPRRGARSIGIGHPRSGDRCAAPHPLPHDPDRGRRASNHIPATRKGSSHDVCAYTSVIGTSCLDRCLWNGHPCGCRCAE